jgi:hypothetical protein
MSTKNSVNNASGDFTIDPGASGNSFVQFDINATGEFRIGVDDSDGDNFKISQGSALGTNDFFDMNPDGERLMTSQPAFSASNTTIDNNVTGNGTVYTLTYDGEIFDQNADYDGISTFTAPVDGRYDLAFIIQVRNLDTDVFTSFRLQIVTSNRTYQLKILNPETFARGGGFNFMQSAAVFADMDSGDTATCTVTVFGGTQTVGVTNDASPARLQANFKGFLTC